MKKLSIITFILLGSAHAQAQSEIAPEKKKIIAEIVSVSKADVQTEETMLLMMNAVSSSYSTSFQTALDKNSNFSQDQKKKLGAEFVQRFEVLRAKFTERLKQKVNLKEFGVQMIYQLYNKFFNENELKDLLVFYKTPTGRKLNEITPQMTTESIRISQEVLMPKVLKIVDELIQEDINEVKKTFVQTR